ncbi:MAG: class I SAM-dependent methyltransferase [Lachnospiraceae bacterium]|nr:class I SAM-dependent methyltransferase [Lachnospiraceae bacterium]
MDAYTGFASVYDDFMEDVPYDKWRDLIVRTLKEKGIEDGLVCELGAGTGEMTARLRDAGYDMIGVDNSEEMLGIARSKEGDSNEILYLCQDMREFELYGTVRAVVSVCDSVNYITEYEDLVRVFKLVNNYLDPGGLFLFDFNTRHKYRDVIGDTTIAEDRDNASFVWENTYYPDEDINEYNITFFVKEEGSELFRRFKETHFQRGYTLSDIKKALKEAGLVFVSALDSETEDKADSASERIFVIAKEKGK